MKRTTLILASVLVLASTIGGIFWLKQKEDVLEMSPIKSNQNTQTSGTNQENSKENDQNPVLQPSSDYSIRPDFSKVKDFTQTLTLQKGVSVKYGDGWVGKKTGDDEFVSGGLFKTVNGRSYVIGFQENNAEYLSADGAYANGSLKVYQEVMINNKPHFITTSSLSAKDPIGEKVYDYAYVSSCPVKTTEACSLPLSSTSNLLFIMLRQDVPGAQYPVELDFSRPDDQQILAEFAEIMSTLKY